MSDDPKKLERTINRRVANGIWWLMGLTTSHILLKMSRKQGDDAVYGIIILTALYFCYVFFQRFADASRSSGEQR